jgi:hypothetical protein
MLSNSRFSSSVNLTAFRSVGTAPGSILLIENDFSIFTALFGYVLPRCSPPAVSSVALTLHHVWTVRDTPQHVDGRERCGLDSLSLHATRPELPMGWCIRGDVRIIRVHPETTRSPIHPVSGWSRLCACLQRAYGMCHNPVMGCSTRIQWHTQREHRKIFSCRWDEHAPTQMHAH